jgi:hypothetical protein
MADAPSVERSKSMKRFFSMLLTTNVLMAAITVLIASSSCAPVHGQTRAKSTRSKLDLEKLKQTSDVVVILRVETVERLSGYAGLSIDGGSSWYVVRGNVASVLHGKVPSDMKTIDVLLLAKADATVFGYGNNPRGTNARGVIARHSKTLVRSPRGIGKGKPKQVEILAFLKKTVPVTPYRANDKPPFIFRPTSGYEFGTASLKVL